MKIDGALGHPGMEPRYSAKELEDRGWRMVICYVTGQQGYHAIYAEDYDTIKKTFACVNSWGDNNQPNPEVSKDKVYGIFYVSIIDCDSKL